MFITRKSVDILNSCYKIYQKLTADQIIHLNSCQQLK